VILAGRCSFQITLIVPQAAVHSSQRRPPCRMRGSKAHAVGGWTEWSTMAAAWPTRRSVAAACHRWGWRPAGCL